MKTQAELRAFSWGIMAGIALLISVVIGISVAAGVRFQPVLVDR